MQSLAENACRPPGDPRIDKCANFPNSFVGIGPQVPPWADRSVPIGKNEYVWVPAHPRDTFATRDSEMFLALYKLYQMSLVDTSKLVSGTTPITISK